MQTHRELAELAKRAADAARMETRARFGRVATEWKADGSPVTEADRAAERVLREVLLAGAPGYGFLGEEYGAAQDSGEADGRRWVVDPIDGTIAYAAGIPLYSTLIGLLEDGEPVVGLIDLPELDQRLIGWKGGGGWVQGQPIQRPSCATVAEAFLAVGDRDAFALSEQEPALDRALRSARRVRAYTDAFGHSLVLRGAMDAMIDPHLSPWDLVATRAIAAEVGVATALLPTVENTTLLLGSPAVVEELRSWPELAT